MMAYSLSCGLRKTRRSRAFLRSSHPAKLCDQANRGILKQQALVKQTARFLNASRIVLAHPSVFRSRRYVFLLSHMRGYTSLLSHILGSHPEISGYAEASNAYRTALDLLKLRCMAYYHGNYKPNCRYFLDKLLHNRFEISDAMLARDDIRYLFMVREPGPTVKSTVALRLKKKTKKTINRHHMPPASVEKVMSDYLARIRMLVTIGERLHRLGKQALVIQAENLIQDASPLLVALEDFLGLRTALDQHYSVFDRTGASGFGDTSDFIRKGKIERRRHNYDDVVISDDLAAEGDHVYAECLSTLRNLFPTPTTLLRN